MSDRPQSPRRKHFFPRMGGPGDVQPNGEYLSSRVLNDSNPVKTTKTRPGPNAQSNNDTTKATGGSMAGEPTGAPSGPNAQSNNDATAEGEFDPEEYESPFPQYTHDADNCTAPSICPLHSPSGLRFGGMPMHPQLGNMYSPPYFGGMSPPPYLGSMGPPPYLRGMGPYLQGMDQPPLFRDMPPRSYPRDSPFTPPSLNLNRPSDPDMSPSVRALRARARRAALKSIICDPDREDIALMLTVCVMAWLWGSPPSVPFSEPMTNVALWMTVWCVGLHVWIECVTVWEERKSERKLVEMECRDKEQMKQEEEARKEGRDGAAASGASSSERTEGEAEWEMA